MKITKVSYSRLVNLGNYQNERIGMVAQIQENETPEQAVEQLKAKIQPLLGEDANKLDNRRCQLRNEIDDLERKLSRYQQQWNDTAAFLRAQGIKPDAPNFPVFAGLLAPAVEEVEFVEDDDEEDEYDDDGI